MKRVSEVLEQDSNLCRSDCQEFVALTSGLAYLLSLSCHNLEVSKIWCLEAPRDAM